MRPRCSSTNFRERASPSPVPSTFLSGPHLTKLFEHRLLIFGRDPDAGVRDRHLHQLVVHRDAHVDPATRGRELQGIGEQVQEHLLDLALVGPNRADAAVDVAPCRADTRLACR